jgi:hypothetical protein
MKYKSILSAQVNFKKSEPQTRPLGKLIIVVNVHYIPLQYGYIKS